MDERTAGDGGDGVSVSRRRLVFGGAALAAAFAAAGCATGQEQPADPNDPPDPDPAAPILPAVGMTTPLAATPASGGDVVAMHIVAHPDDDLYFFNPDIWQSITAGHQVVGVWTTAAESAGRNGPQAKHSDDQAYARARQNGLRGAYALMATGDASTPWNRDTLTLPNGAVAEIDRLSGGRAPVTLVFLNIRKQGGKGRLRNLWSGHIRSIPTLVPTGAPVAGVHHYTRDGLINTLTYLLTLFRPTLVRTQDLDPDYQIHDVTHPQNTDYGNLTDHQDHTATAQFTWAALPGYTGPGEGRHWVLESYRGYYNCRWPYDLSVAAFAAKNRVLDVYDGATPYDCGDPAGCADLSVKGRVAASGWAQSTNYRYQGTTSWLRLGDDGRLVAFGVVDQQAASWRETAPASGQFGPPTLLGGAPLVPQLAVARTADGAFLLAGEQIGALNPHGDDSARAIVLFTQQRRGGAFQLTNLGAPPSSSGNQRHLGCPALAVDTAGRVHLVVRTWRRGIAGRVRGTDGVWSPWTDYGGGPVQEGLCVLPTADGRVEVYGAGKPTLERWYQPAPGADLRPAGGALPPAPGTPPTALALPDDRALIVYRLPRTAQVAAVTLDLATGRWQPSTPASLGGQGGFGPMPLLAFDAHALDPHAHDPHAHDAHATRPAHGTRVALAQRNDAGATSVTTFTAPPTDVPRWRSGGGLFAHAPALAHDARGRLVLAELGPDATPRLRIVAEAANG